MSSLLFETIFSSSVIIGLFVLRALNILGWPVSLLLPSTKYCENGLSESWKVETKHEQLKERWIVWAGRISNSYTSFKLFYFSVIVNLLGLIENISFSFARDIFNNSRRFCAVYLVVGEVDRIVGHGILLLSSFEIWVTCLLELKQPLIFLRSV